MTIDELNDALDAMQSAAGEDVAKRPGLIEVETDDYVDTLHALQTTRPRTLVDGIRIRDIKVAVGGVTATRLLTRDEAAERGEPYRDLAERT